MIIFRTHPEHISKIVCASKHALASWPRNISQGDLILISQTIAQTNDGFPPIRYVMEFVEIKPDSGDESGELFGKHWPYIVHGRNCHALKHPFDIRKVKVSKTNYSQGGSYVYVAQEDEAKIRKLCLLEPA